MASHHHSFRAAAVQAAPVFLNLEVSIDKAIALIEEAANAGAELIAFPETFLPGYPWHIWLDSPAWAFQFTAEYFDNSLEYGSVEADRLAAAARDNHIMVVMGLSERFQGSLYIAQWIIGADGRTIATRRKLKRPTWNGPCTGRATEQTFRSTTPISAESGHCAAGSTFSRCRNTQCTRRTNRFTSVPGPVSRSTQAQRMRWAPR